MSAESLLKEFEVIELKDVEGSGERPITINEVELARVKLAKKLEVLRKEQLEQKLEREQINKGLDEMKKFNEEKKKEERSNKIIATKLAKLEDLEKARQIEFEKYLRRYKENSESRRNTSELPILSGDSGKIIEKKKELKIRRAKSERQNKHGRKVNTEGREQLDSDEVDIVNG